MNEPVVAALLLLALALAVISVRAADLLIAAIALGAFSFALALVWAALGAVDVAFTEAVVGAGATTVYFLFAILRTSRRRSPVPSAHHHAVLGAVVVVGILLLLTMRGLPRWGDPAAPPASHVSPRYLAQSIEEMETPNTVTAVLADYRSYDTLIETVVILTAGLGGWLLLARPR